MRNVTHVHFPTEPLTRAPWQDSRRQLHNRGGTSWPAVSTPHRQLHTDTDTDDFIQEETPTSTIKKPRNPNKPHKKPRWRDIGKTHNDLVKFKGRREVVGPVEELASPLLNDDPRFPRDSAEARAAYTGRAARMAHNERTFKEKTGTKGGKNTWTEKEKERQRKENKPMWALQKEALKEKFPEGWQPRKRLSPDAIAGIKELHRQFPDLYTTPALAQKFEVSPEAIRRILRAKWQPTAEEEEVRQARWFRRGTAVWSRWAELGVKPPKKWREEGIERREPRQYDAPHHGEKTPWDTEDIDPEKARRLKVQSRISQNLV